MAPASDQPVSDAWLGVRAVVIDLASEELEITGGLIIVCNPEVISDDPVPYPIDSVFPPAPWPMTLPACW